MHLELRGAIRHDNNECNGDGDQDVVGLFHTCSPAEM